MRRVNRKRLRAVCREEVGKVQYKDVDRVVTDVDTGETTVHTLRIKSHTILRVPFRTWLRSPAGVAAQRRLSA